MKNFMLFLFFSFLFVSSAQAYYQSDSEIDEYMNVPADQLMKDLTDAYTKNPNDRETLYGLGVLHAMLFVTDLKEVTVFKHRPSKIFKNRDVVGNEYSAVNHQTPQAKNFFSEMELNNAPGLARKEYLTKATDFFKKALLASDMGEGAGKWSILDEDINLYLAKAYEQNGENQQAIAIYREMIKGVMEKRHQLEMENKRPEYFAPDDYAYLAIERLIKLLDPEKDKEEINLLKKYQESIIIFEA